jgi:hypothetical protein
MKYMWYAPLMVDPLSEPCQSAHIQWYLDPNNHLKLHVPYWNFDVKIHQKLGTHKSSRRKGIETYKL